MPGTAPVNGAARISSSSKCALLCASMQLRLGIMLSLFACGNTLLSPLNRRSPSPHLSYRRRGRGSVLRFESTSPEGLPPSQRRKLDREMASIALPALVGLTIDPIASLVDTAMIGRYCTSADLAGAGVAISVFNLISRTFNFLSSATTSQVASLAPLDAEPGVFSAEMSRGAAAALAVALVVGLSLALACTLGGGLVLECVGLPAGSPVRGAARRYLAARALAFPASLSLMALEGAFRGARDTKAPLGALALATGLNILLDPILIIGCRGGVVGAAVATTAAQYAAALLLWRRLARACGDACAVATGQDGRRPIFGLPPPRVSACLTVARQGSWLTLRTFSGSSALAYSSVCAAALGAASGAAHQISFQLWMAASLLADAVAVAAQALTASALGRGDGATARWLFRRTMGIGLVIGGLTAAGLALGSSALCGLFTSEAAVLGACTSCWPLVVLTQPLNTLAFAVDGLLFGASDFRFCALMQASAALAAVSTMRWLAPALGLRAVWFGLGLYMAARAALGSLRIASRRGPWRALKRG